MNNKIRIIAVIVGVFLLLVVIFLSLFFNRRFEVRFYLDNGANVGTVQVKYNKMINEEDIKGKDVLDKAINSYTTKNTLNKLDKFKGKKAFIHWKKKKKIPWDNP